MKSQQEHRLDDGCSCPVCGSGKLEAGSLYGDADGGTYQETSCRACHSSWLDQYTLSGFAMIETVRTGAELMIKQERRVMTDWAPLFSMERGMGFVERARARIKRANHGWIHSAY